MKNDITTGTLTNILTQATESELHKTLRDNREALLDPDKPFAAALRETMAQRGWSQTALYTRAGLSKGTLDKYLRGERLPRDRDTVLRLCVTMGCDGRQTDRLLKAADHSPLYARAARDVIILRALADHVSDTAELDRRLARHGFAPLLAQEGKED